MEWFEELPPSCPPSDATDCQGTYYRVSNGNPAESCDFFSQRLLAPDKKFKGEGIDECIVRAVSVLNSKGQTLQNYIYKNKTGRSRKRSRNLTILGGEANHSM